MPREFYRDIIDPFLRNKDSEIWHTKVVNALHLAESNPLTLKLLELFIHQMDSIKDERLKVVVGGIEFKNPLMVAAGWDKEGKAPEGLFVLGFSGDEVGTVTLDPQPGNPKPRQYMIAPGVSLNSMGFNSPGADEVAKNLKRYKGSGIPIGISIGINKNVKPSEAPEGYAAVAEKLYEYASYFAINVSSPNTKGLRDLQDEMFLTDIVQAVKNRVGERKPIFVKISPDLELEEIDKIITVVIDNRLAGIIATNTTSDPKIKAEYGKWAGVPGGIGGDNYRYRVRSDQVLAHIYKETLGKLDVIAVGGVDGTLRVLEKIMLGAKITQAHTAIRTEGPMFAVKTIRGLIRYMDSTGMKSLDEIRGINVR